jgi:hypothetical protein
VIKSRGLRGARLVELVEEMKNAYEILIWKPEGRGHIGDLFIEERIIL